MEYNSIVIHYSEIGLKKKNREFFERKLIENIKTAMSHLVKSVYWMYGRVACELKENDSEENIKKIQDILYNTPGIASFVFSRNVNLDIDTIKKTSLDMAEKQILEIIEKRKNQKTKDRTILITINQIYYENLSESLRNVESECSYDFMCPDYQA